MNTETVKISELTTDPVNARRHSARNLEAIKGSLQRFGQQKPIVVDKKNVVVAGNGTLEAARLLGWEEIEVTRTELQGSDRAAFSIADNRTAELADWDDDALGKALAALQCDESFDEFVTGFSENEIETLLNNAIDTDYEPGESSNCDFRSIVLQCSNKQYEFITELFSRYKNTDTAKGDSLHPQANIVFNLLSNGQFNCT